MMTGRSDIRDRVGRGAWLVPLLLLVATVAHAQIAVRGDTVYTMAGPPIADGVVLLRDGMIERVGPRSEVVIPTGYRTLTAAVVTPGLIDAHSVVGLAGYLNQEDDQDMLDRAAPIQPELRAIDAYDPSERLVEWLRGFGITTIHTGHGPGALVSGQTMVVKTVGRSIDDAVVLPTAMVAATLGESARAARGQSPGTRGKMVAMLRGELVKAQEYVRRQDRAEPGDEPATDLRLESLARVLSHERPLLVTAHRARDILTAIRIATEFDVRIVLDGAAEAHLVIDQIKDAGVPVIVHPTMYPRYGRDRKPELRDRRHAKGRGDPDSVAKRLRRLCAPHARRVVRGRRRGCARPGLRGGARDDHNRGSHHPGHCGPRGVTRGRQGCGRRAVRWRPLRIHHTLYRRNRQR